MGDRGRKRNSGHSSFPSRNFPSNFPANSTIKRSHSERFPHALLGTKLQHLPPGEAFDSEMNRPVVPVLRGVPEPVTDAEGALKALRAQLEARPEDDVLLLDAFALACRLGERELASELLQRWQVVAQAEVGESGFATDPGSAPQRRAELFRRLLPG